MSKTLSCTIRGAALISLPLAAILLVLVAGKDAPRIQLTNTNLAPITAHMGTN